MFRFQCWLTTIADINTEIRAICDATSTELTAATLLYRVNQAYEQITAKIIEETAGARRQYGDFNYTAFPTFTINLTDNVQSYSLTNISTTPLTIMGVEVVDAAGNQRVLRQISLKEIQESGIAFGRYLPTKALPFEYEIRENMIVLYPPPSSANVTLTNGLIIYYLRTADTFTSAQVTTGTKEPGFPGPYHMLLVFMAAMPYLMSYKPERIAYYQGEINRLWDGLLGFISKRDQNDRPIMTTKPIVHF